MRALLNPRACFWSILSCWVDMGIGDRKRRPPLLVWLLFRAPRRWGVTDSRIKRLGSFERNYNWMYSLNIQSGPLLSTYRVKVIHFSCEEKFNFSLTFSSQYLWVESWWSCLKCFKADKNVHTIAHVYQRFHLGAFPPLPPISAIIATYPSAASYFYL